MTKLRTGHQSHDHRCTLINKNPLKICLTLTLELQAWDTAHHVNKIDMYAMLFQNLSMNKVMDTSYTCTLTRCTFM